MLTRIYLLFLVSLFASFGYSQNEVVADSSKANLFALPVVYYTPETTWSFGGLGILTFPIDSLSPRSQVQLGLAYTLLDQILVYLPFQLYMQQDQLRLIGELGYYRYNYFFYGVGNDFTDYEGETYGVDFPRIRFNAIWRLGQHQFAGLRYAWDNWEVYDQAAGGLLEHPTVTGNQASAYSALGPIWQRDSRDHLFFPTKGSWVEASFLASSNVLGATQNFVKWTLDARTYQSKKTDHIWAAQLYLEGNSGTPPFNQLALLGGTRLLRGYYEGRFRDRQLAVAQLEYRFPVYRRFAGTAFASLGSVTHQWSDWEGNFLRYTIGAGIRFMLLPEDKIRLRFDYGIGKNTSAFYFTVGEAF